MTRLPTDTQWDDPEEYPEDDEDGDVHPYDPPLPGTVSGESVVLSRDPTILSNPDRRERRQKRIDDYLSTKEYRERQREVLRSRRSFR